MQQSDITPLEYMFGRKSPCHLLDIYPGGTVPESVKVAGSALAKSMAQRVREANRIWQEWTARRRCRLDKAATNPTRKIPPLESLGGESGEYTAYLEGREHRLQYDDEVYIRRSAANKLFRHTGDPTR